MPLNETLRTIITDYPKARNEPFAGHPLGAFIRGDAANTVEQALGELGAGLLVEGSAGAGNWAAVPWISVFDPAITTSATHGYYVVYNRAARWATAPENVRCAEGIRQSLGHIDVHHQIAGISVTALRRSQIGAPIKPLR